MTETTLLNIQGAEIVVSDGVNCTVIETQCISSEGDVYELKNGELVAAENGNSGFSGIFILLMSLLALVQFTRNIAKAPIPATH